MNQDDLLAYADMLNSCEAKFACKALDYLDGEQDEHLICVLNDPDKGRRKWQQRGIIPRTRNLTKMIVEKSGLLFIDAAPTLQVYEKGSQVPDDAETQALMELMDETEWQEFFINVDKVTRLLKTSVVLIQYDEESKALCFDLLHRGNCQVITNANNKGINTLIYEVGDIDGTSCAYRMFTADTITDFTVTNKKQVTTMTQMDNPYGCVPAVPFYDTGTPRVGFWAEAPTDLISINELYNLHITDSEFAISWMKLQTLFTNAKMEGDSSQTFEVTMNPQSVLPRMAPDATQMIGGPGVAIYLETNGGEAPFVEYKGPNVDLQPLDNVVNKWISDFAGDWSVNMKAGGDGSAATSGFQLIVEEMDNLELRKTRQRMFEAGFKRFFRVIKDIASTLSLATFSEDSNLFAEFRDPVLPVDLKAQEEMWSIRLANGRASRVDYFMQVWGMNKEEAQAKIVEIDLEAKANLEPKAVQVLVTRNSSGA